MDLTKQFNDQDIVRAEIQDLDKKLIETTVGRVVFNMHLPERIPFINGLLKKKGLQELVNYCFISYGNAQTVEMPGRPQRPRLPLRHQGRRLHRRRRGHPGA